MGENEMIKITDNDYPVELLIYENECSIFIPESENPNEDVVFTRTASGKLMINAMEVSDKMEALLIMYLQKKL